jgi:hypothetical protein
MTDCPANPTPEHIASCEECSVTAVVHPWMKRFAALPDREHILPHPSILWLKAQVMRSSAEVARASRPMTYVQIAAYLIVAAGWAGLLTWKWDAVQAMLKPFESPFSSLATFATLLVLATVTVTLALHTILAEE